MNTFRTESACAIRDLAAQASPDNTKRPPGERWEVVDDAGLDESLIGIVNDSGAAVAHVERWDGDNDRDLMAVAVHNANTIAAAPELLAAARLVVDRWEQGDLADAVRSLASAIARAEGAIRA